MRLTDAIGGMLVRDAVLIAVEASDLAKTGLVHSRKRLGRQEAATSTLDALGRRMVFRHLRGRLGRGLGFRLGWFSHRPILPCNPVSSTQSRPET